MVVMKQLRPILQ